MTDTRAAFPAKLLDVGAGDGHVTSHLEPLFEEITATEASTHMGKRLRARGYRYGVPHGRGAGQSGSMTMSATAHRRVVEDLDLSGEVKGHGPFDVVR